MLFEVGDYLYFRVENRARRSYNKGLEKLLTNRTTYADDYLPKITKVTKNLFSFSAGSPLAPRIAILYRKSVFFVPLF